MREPFADFPNRAQKNRPVFDAGRLERVIGSEWEAVEFD